MRYMTSVAYIFDCAQINDSSCETVELAIFHKIVEESLGSCVVSCPVLPTIPLQLLKSRKKSRSWLNNAE